MKILVNGYNMNIKCAGDKDIFKSYQFIETFHNNILFDRLGDFVTLDYVSKYSFLYLSFDKTL